MANKIVVVDGLGNLRSVAQALRAADPEADVLVSNNAADIDAADRIVLPGQGAMRDCMSSLRESGAEEALLRAVIKVFEDEGFGVVGADQLLGGETLPAGALGRIAPDAESTALNTPEELEAFAKSF